MAKPPGASEVAQRAAAFPEGLPLHNLSTGKVAGCPEIGPPLRAWAKALHAAGVANMAIGSPELSLADAVDVWIVDRTAYRADPARVRGAIARGGRVWGTTALATGDAASPAWLLGRPGLGYRLLPGFLSQSLGFVGLYYWAVDAWRADPYADVGYRSADGQVWPGEGVLVYPGGPAGVAGVVPSVRLKQVRDGIEDYDLLALARARRLPGLDEAIAAVAGREWQDAAVSAAMLETARQRIGAAFATR
jgi:hypothetical protein